MIALSRLGRRLLFCTGLLAALAAPLAMRLRPSAVAADGGAKLELHKGDRIAILGNTLADRMQHDGWLETLFHARHAKDNLVFRNLGFSGDELTQRLRSAAFGSPDEWLTRAQTDVVFAFFGYNESFAGADGLDKFRKDLEQFIQHTLSQKYNGKSAPRLVLFSPIAHENLRDPNLPDGSENNARLKQYTSAMADVAKARNVAFVDLFTPTLELYAKAKQPLTINGVHLTEAGNRQLAQVIVSAVSGGAAPTDPVFLEKIRQAVRDKNHFWFNRYRTVDGYSIYGGRADLRFVGGQTNRVVMQREMEVLDVMTANRDKRINAIAASGGREAPTVNDDNAPPFIPVETNKPGPIAGGKHLILGGEEAISKMTLGKGLKINLFASEKEFPEIANPVQMAWDTKGRLWVACWPTYPHWKPKEEMNDKLVILEDTDGDGKADRSTVFAGDLHCPTGFEFYNGGVLVAVAPDVLFLKDTDGDGKADVRERVLSGICSADTHHAANSFVLDPGGALYFQEGTFHHTQVESPWAPTERCANAGVFRYEPRSQKFEVYVTFGFANPHGHIFDRWGQDIVVDGTGANPYHAALFSGRLEFPNKHNRPPQVYQQRTRPCSGIEYLSSRHFPDEWQGHLLVANVIGFQGILRYQIADKDSSFAGTEQEPILSSTDPHFRPTDIKIGPDGAIYFSDWQNPIIGHMQHNLRDPSRDREHGRVYRIVHEGRPLLKPKPIAGEPIDKLLALLKEPEDRVRYRARIELTGRKSTEVIDGVKTWMANLDEKDPNHEHHLLEALWMHQHHNVVNESLLRRMLGSSDFRARAAAARVLCYWRDRVSNSLGLFKQLAADAHPRVRLEAVRAASFYKVPEAIEIPLIASEHPSDLYLDFTRGETQRALDPYVKKAIAENRKIAFTTTAGARYFLKNVGTDDLLKMKRDLGVYTELLFRHGVRDEIRREAITGLAKLERKPELRVLLDAIANHERQVKSQDAAEESVFFDLARVLTSRPSAELKSGRGDLQKLATDGRLPVTRQLGFVALIAADNSIDPAWKLATSSLGSLRDLVSAMPLIRDPNLRAALYPKVEPLLTGLPKELAPKAGGKIIPGRYVRIELPGKQRTLTLAEVEVFSDGRNIARKGKATQHSTAHGGAAARAIDGNKSGAYTDGGQTHTQEGVDNPWWEVDLGGELPIDSVVVYNRTDGNMSTRLRNYTLKVLDANRKVVVEQKNLPTPEVQATHAVGGESPERIVRRAAMFGLTTVRGQEAAAFKAIAAFLKDDRDRPLAVQALQRIPNAYWPKEEAQPLLQQLMAFVRTVPQSERTSPVVLDTLQFADALAALLPPEQAKQTRRELGELGVRVIRIGTLTDQMLYDKERIVVQAGKPVEFIFENTDLMPHNLVIVQPGALAEVGEAAEASATQPGAFERHFVPPSNKILLASRLIQPRQSQQLAFTAPTKPGVYPYVCTYPGHWRRMHGALYVVASLEDYQADPEAYLAKHPLPIQDELLKFNRPRKEWTLAELTPALELLDQGRSHAHGKQLFQIASCSACHRLGDVGVLIGQDLNQLDPKYKPLDVLREILDPSAKIDEKFRSNVIETVGGKVVTGLVLEENDKVVKIIENPLAKSEPVVIKKTDIAERGKLPVSLMPKGLLDKLTREEILDLLAYILAKGDPNHAVYKGGCGHKH